MALRESMEKQGNWLFRWRSYLPLLGVPILLIALRNPDYIEKTFGETAAYIWGFFSLFVSFLGFLVRCVTAGYVSGGTSGRNTKSQIADSLNMTGIYSIVRNPLYFGNFVIVLGLALFVETWWFVLIYCLAFWIYYERIIFAEEEFLRRKFGDSFLKWSERTPAFFPKFSNWKQPDLPFSAKTVLRREFSGFFAIVASFTGLGAAKNIFAEGRLSIDMSWAVIFGVSLVIYLTLYLFKKKTKVLHSPGR